MKNKNKNLSGLDFKIMNIYGKRGHVNRFVSKVLSTHYGIFFHLSRCPLLNVLRKRMKSDKCFLISVEGKHDPVLLADGKEVLFGRGPESKIYENRVSREQIKLVADYDKREAKLTQLGRNSSAVNGITISKDSTVTVKEGDRIELLLGHFMYKVGFEPPEEETGSSDCPRLPLSEPHSSNKRAVSESRVEGEEDKEDLYEPTDKRAKVTEEEPKERMEVDAWELVDEGKLLVYTDPRLTHSTMIASYDLDWTLIGTKSGVTFPKNKDDWRILYPTVVTKLKEWHDKKYKIVVFTNQSTISSSKTNEINFKYKIERIVAQIDVPLQMFIATGHSFYRKPAIGMWDALCERNGGLKIDMEKSFYCGDAAGREFGDFLRKKDFSHCDLLFAKNLRLRFETPEHHFLNKEMQPLRARVFNPNTIRCDIPLCTPSCGQVISSRLELIILVGCPGSGKSHFAKTHLLPAGYVHVNRDTLGSWQKCVTAMQSALKAKQKVVVDNTNPDIESRKRYITIAKHYTALVRCFIMNTSFSHARHNNKFRQLTDPSHAIITDLIMNTYKSKYQEPTLAEGFSEILRINFWPTFKDPNHEKLYKLFLLEK